MLHFICLSGTVCDDASNANGSTSSGPTDAHVPSWHGTANFLWSPTPFYSTAGILFYYRLLSFLFLSMSSSLTVHHDIIVIYKSSLLLALKAIEPHHQGTSRRNCCNHFSIPDMVISNCSYCLLAMYTLFDTIFAFTMNI
jgi:hypothetical protein